MNADPDHLLDLLARRGKELHALLYRLTLRADVAEDLLQDLFLRLRATPGFISGRDRLAYAFRTAINLAFDRRRARRPVEPLRHDPAAGVVSPLDCLVQAEELEAVLDAMQHLSEQSREVVVMRFLQQRSYADVARQLGKTEHQVRGLCAKGLTQLRAALRPTAHEQSTGGKHE